MYRDKWSSRGGVVRVARNVISSSVCEDSLFDNPRTGRFADNGRFYKLILWGIRKNLGFELYLCCGGSSGETGYEVCDRFTRLKYTKDFFVCS